MPSKIKRRSRKNSFIAKLDEETIEILFYGDLKGMLLNGKEEQDRKDQFRKAWLKYKSYLIDLWQSSEWKTTSLKSRLFQRPWAFWQFDSDTPITQYLIDDYRKDYLIRKDLLTNKEKEILKNEK